MSSRPPANGAMKMAVHHRARQAERNHGTRKGSRAHRSGQRSSGRDAISSRRSPARATADRTGYDFRSGPMGIRSRADERADGGAAAAAISSWSSRTIPRGSHGWCVKKWSLVALTARQDWECSGNLTRRRQLHLEIERLKKVAGIVDSPEKAAAKRALLEKLGSCRRVRRERKWSAQLEREFERRSWHGQTASDRASTARRKPMICSIPWKTFAARSWKQYERARPAGTLSSVLALVWRFALGQLAS